MKNLLLVMIMGFWCSSAWATEIDAGKACLGRPDGKQKMKDESWSYKYSCKNGKLDGVVITIHKMSGELTSETPFVDGKRNGIQKTTAKRILNQNYHTRMIYCMELQRCMKVADWSQPRHIKKEYASQGAID